MAPDISLVASVFKTVGVTCRRKRLAPSPSWSSETGFFTLILADRLDDCRYRETDDCIAAADATK